MRKLTLVVLIALLAITFVGCGRSAETEIVKVDCDPPAMLSASLEASMAAIYLPYSLPPEITSEEGWILMNQVDAMLADAYASLEEYNTPSGETELRYMGSSDCIPDDVTMRLITLAHNDYDSFVQERLARLESYNEAFVDAGGSIPNWVWEDIYTIRRYVPSDSLAN